MMNSKLKAEELIDKYLSGQCNPEERALVESIYEKTALKRTIEDSAIDFNHIGQESWKHIYTSINEKAPATHKLWLRFAVAASIVIAVGAGIWFYRSAQLPVNDRVQIIAGNDIPPGKNSATLTLANGKTINLSDAKTGVVIDAAALTYNDGSSVVSTAGNVGLSGTIATPKGGQYQVKLPDGTSVWLNAESKLSYSLMPTKASVRRVELHGEAYFEVAKDKSRPFIVNSGKQEVKVLGTHFNINSYQDRRAIITTLIEGSVRVTNRDAKIENVLKPGEQAILTDNGQINVAPANIKDALAWKSGYFRFKAERIDEVMIQLTRWYNIKVDYEGEISEEKFSGNISKYKNISEVLNMLSYSNDVKFKVEGRRVTVMK